MDRVGVEERVRGWGRNWERGGRGDFDWNAKTKVNK